MNAARLPRRLLVGGSVTFAAAVAAVGWMHTPAARPVLRALGVHCPVDSATPAQVAALRELGLARFRGAARAPLRPALGMSLDHTTEQEVLAWAHMKSANCKTVVHGDRFLRCRGVDARALGLDGPAISELWFSFGSAGTLVGVDVYRRGLDAQESVAAWSGATRTLKTQLGPPQVEFGDASPKVLLASALQTARVQYRYSDYVATITAVNLPYAGLAVREQYLSARRPY